MTVGSSAGHLRHDKDNPSTVQRGPASLSMLTCACAQRAGTAIPSERRPEVCLAAEQGAHAAGAVAGATAVASAVVAAAIATPAVAASRAVGAVLCAAAAA